MDNVTSLADAKFRKAQADKRDGEGGDGRPVIRLGQGELPEILNKADAALGKYDVTIFTQLVRLVRVTTLPETKTHQGIRRQAGAIIIQPVNPAHLVDRFMLAADWERYDKRLKDWVRADAPRSLAESFIARAGDWQHVPPLTGIIEAPTVRPDGSVLEAPGYDAPSGIYFSGKLPENYVELSPQPSRADAEEALDQLRAAIWDFPFITESDRVAAISCMITALVRRTLPAAPMFAITAPTAGTGKSKLAYVAAIVATGRRPPVLSLGDDKSEGEKRLAAALLAGDTIIMLDNIERPLYGDLLCQVLSEPSVNLRPLGGSDQTTIVSNSVFIATGNNLDIRGDLKRRTMLIRLDAGMERPELRKFEHDVLETTAARRGELIRAALTIVRAYLLAGSPTVDFPPLGGFEAWDAWCRRPLLWLGCPDPLLASEEVRAEDPDISMQRALFAAWQETFGNKPVSASAITHAATQSTADQNLHEAVLAVCGEKITSKRLGYWLRRHQRRMVDGFRLEAGGEDTHAKIKLWRLVAVTSVAGNGG